MARADSAHIAKTGNVEYKIKVSTLEVFQIDRRSSLGIAVLVIDLDSVVGLVVFDVTILNLCSVEIDLLTVNLYSLKSSCEVRIQKLSVFDSFVSSTIIYVSDVNYENNCAVISVISLCFVSIVISQSVGKGVLSIALNVGGGLPVLRIPATCSEAESSVKLYYVSASASASAGSFVPILASIRSASASAGALYNLSRLSNSYRANRSVVSREKKSAVVIIFFVSFTNCSYALGSNRKCERLSVSVVNEYRTISLKQRITGVLLELLVSVVFLSLKTLDMCRRSGRLPRSPDS